MTLNKTAYAILGLLTIEPMTGYAMRQSMKESTAYFWSESDGQLYPALTLLAKQNLIAIKKSLSNKKNNKKKEYSITLSGKKALQGWLKEPAETKIVRDEFMLKLFFGGNVEPEIMVEQLTKQTYEIKSALSDLSKIKMDLLKDKKSVHYDYWDISVDYGIQLLESKLNWLNQAIKRLEKPKKIRGKN